MLTHLSVQNYALINKLEVDFGEGLTIITGETGAGKSILLGALALIEGNRADLSSLFDKQKKCVIEASFNISEYGLKHFFSENNLDYEELTTIRREINPEGKSRAFVNDTPVNLSLLKELSEKLIDIHSQHQTLTINGSVFQLSAVDAYAQHGKLLQHYTENYKTYKQLEQVLSELVSAEMQAKKEADYFQFQFDELEQAGLKSDEQSHLEQELQLLNNSEEIKKQFSKILFSLDGGEQNIIASLAELKSAFASIAKYKPEIGELFNRLNSAYIEMKDICNEVENIDSEVLYDQSRVDFVSSRLDVIYSLQQKHHVKTIDELINIKNELSDKLLGFNSIEEKIESTKKQLNELQLKLAEMAQNLSSNRKKVIPVIEKESAALLASLSMNNAQLKIMQTLTDGFTPSGTDKIVFLFSANKGGELKELNKVASGGELSRLMLVLKSLIAQHTSLPTIIFDEIDTGVSGDVADKVGNIMISISKNIQVIAITHLPQIASKGREHLMVYKETTKDKTYSNIRKLALDERVTEIAKMLSTENPTAAAIKNAEDLLNAAKY